MLRISQNMSLQQKMAPQLIQSLQLLQMSTLELELEIKQQLELNPLLEESMEQLEESEEPKEEVEAVKEEEELPQETEEVDWDAMLDEQFDTGSYNSERTEYDPNWEVDREPQENRITTIPPLVERLHEQLALSDLPIEDREIGELIIGNLDDRGYLGCPLGEVAADLDVEDADVEQVLRVIQTFEPPGIAARDLRESLLIQLALNNEPFAELALEIVRDHMEDLTRRRLTRITRALGISNDVLKDALAVIEGLQPYPGSMSSSDYNGLLTMDTEVSYITPDLIVEKEGEVWVVSLTDGTLPSLRINAVYTDLLKKPKKKKKKKGPDEVKTYVSKKLNDARWLINAIHQRRTTMLKVANYLVRAQMGFFEHGSSHLRPMVLQDVADEVEMHVSTISRVSNGKYMQTPHGVFELKYFFDSKVSMDVGEDVSARSVKDKIARMVADENKSKPLSDQEIADELGKDGLRIARRTVAKYRDQLQIASQRYRKEL
ncbi:MAG: RNA polymerase sigma-54 factor [Candidatus Latescibacterota bacterium]|jgi:RNA polymerase sigma-54 factor